MGCSISFNEIKNVLSNFSFIKSDVFVETGTQYGNTIFPISNHFKKLYTIELSETHYKNGIQKAKDQNITNIEFVHGDSSEKLEEVVKQLQEPAIFFLDGHHCGISSDEFATRGEVEAPLYEELEAINKYHNYDCLVIIDDSRCIGNKFPDKDVDWTYITKEGLLAKFDSGKVIHSFDFNDRFWIVLRKI